MFGLIPLALQFVPAPLPATPVPAVAVSAVRSNAACSARGGPQIAVARVASAPADGAGSTAVDSASTPAGNSQTAIGRALNATVAGGIQRPLAERQLEIFRATDGLFYGTAEINGTPLCFLIDTGASMIVLTPEDARRAGVAADAAPTVAADTAAGRRAMARVTLDRVAMGRTEASHVSAAVAGNDLGVSLLGQNWLSYFRSVLIEGDRMTLD